MKCPQNDQEVLRWLQRIHSFLQSISTVGSFPCNHIMGLLGVLAPHLGHIAEYETCFELATELKSEQEGGLSKANTYKSRALAHAHANQFEDALLQASRAQKIWLNEHSIRGYLLITHAMAHWYDQLGYAQAVEYELILGINIATWQPAFMESDIFLAMIVALSSIALKQGRVLRAYRWLFYYQRICHMYRLEPDETILKEILEGNLIVLAAYLYLHNRPIHDRLVEIANNIDTNLLLGYREINLSDDEEFENWLSDLTPEQQEEVRNLRLKVQNEEPKLPEGFIEYDELAQEQYIEWQLPLAIDDILTFRIHYRRDPTLAQMAFTIAVMIQIWSVFLHRDLAGLTLVDDQVDIVLEWQKQDETEPISITSEIERDKLIVTLAITSQYIKQVANIDPDCFLAFFLKIVPHIIHEMSIDPPDEIMHLFDPEKYGAGVNSMIIAGSPAFLWESAFTRTVMGVDDAS